jgi:hypothetical protein
MYKIPSIPNFLLVLLIFTCFVLQSCSRNVPRVDELQSKPEILNISPLSGKVQTTTTIKGSGFNVDMHKDSVYFNGVLSTIIFASTTELIVQVPLLATTGNVTVSIGGVVAKGPLFTVLDPTLVVSAAITSISPSHGVANSIDTIFGSGFDSIITGNVVYFNNVPASVISANPDRLIVKVPESGSGNVSVNVNGTIANGPLFTFDNIAIDTVPRTHTDTLAFLTQKWSSFQDSVSSINYANSNGADISGMLYNPPNDYWNFLSNGNINIVLEGAYFATTFQFLANNQLLITGLPAGLTKPCTIITLTSNTFIFIATDTIPNYGTYYRRVWLKK